jgi:23S rRNA (pseudouridine1915-N3)-methyltransferase
MITFLWVDRTRERHLLALQEDFVGRIRRYEKRVEIVEVRAAKGGNAAERSRREGSALLAGLPARGLRVALDERGGSLATVEFARRLLERRGGGLAFVIGGPDGLSDELLARCDQRLALGPMTLPHEMARVVLLEQVYRGLSFLAGAPYHREGRAGRAP